MNKIKKLDELAWNVDEPTYRADAAISYSKVSRYLEVGHEGLSRLDEKISTPSLTFGSMVDVLLTGGDEEFASRFEVMDMPKLSDSLQQVAATLYASYGDIYQYLSDIPDDIVASVGSECGFYKGDKYRSYRIKLIRESCPAYYDSMSIAGGKEIVSTEDYALAEKCVNTLRTNRYTANYFSAPSGNIDKFYQLKFKGEYDSIPIRCMFDLIVVDHERKRIYPCDLKTSSFSESDFPSAFIKFHYWIQAQMYWYILRHNMDADETYRDYELMNFRFIVINKNNLKPFVWEYPDCDITDTVVYGNVYKTVCKSWTELLIELDGYLKNPSEYPVWALKVNSITDKLNQK